MDLGDENEADRGRETKVIKVNARPIIDNAVSKRKKKHEEAKTEELGFAPFMFVNKNKQAAV